MDIEDVEEKKSLTLFHTHGIMVTFGDRPEHVVKLLRGTGDSPDKIKFPVKKLRRKEKWEERKSV